MTGLSGGKKIKPRTNYLWNSHHKLEKMKGRKEEKAEMAVK